jgi:hypothetical protein
VGKSWILVKKCPACGGKLIVSDFYSFSRDYKITRRGVLSSRSSKSVESSIDCTTASCVDCGAEWEQGEVMILDGKVFLSIRRSGEEA